jgi:protein-S-isoprenylcysteine O-methyltransferase Ste14
MIAAILVAGWAGLMFAAFGLFRRRSTSIIPNRPANALVITGPYRFTRNPMYVSLALLTIALAIVLDTWWPIVLLVPALVIIRVTVIAREERYLRRRFGADYEAYTRRVRRWI